MTAWRADTADTPRSSPPGDRLWINTEECRDLSWSKQSITVPIHSFLLVARLGPPQLVRLVPPHIIVLITKITNTVRFRKNLLTNLLRAL